MRAIFYTHAPYKWILEVFNVDGDVVFKCDDTQTVLNFHVRHWNDVKKRSGKYSVDLTLKDFNHLVNMHGVSSHG